VGKKATEYKAMKFGVKQKHTEYFSDSYLLKNDPAPGVRVLLFPNVHIVMLVLSAATTI